jgi:hypothetical protein
MENNYDKYAKQVQATMDLFETSVKESQDTINKIASDWRFSEKGKAKAREDVLTDLQKTADNLTNLVKEITKRFCNDYVVKLPNDGKDHSEDITNALKIIDMVGFNLTPEILNNVVEPLKGSYKHLKIINDILEARRPVGAVADSIGYDSMIFQMMQEYMGVNTTVWEYIDLFSNIAEVVTTDSIRFRFVNDGVTRDNVSLTNIVSAIPYSILCLGEWMVSAGKMYENLEHELSEVFKMYTPTDTEMIESLLKKDKNTYTGSDNDSSFIWL